ncbi:LysR family transcriptional regulator [Rhizobium leguminosarum]|uniref:LysR family transcriptional regulator n=1 Tax=Rhizobium leguminosarum TaxID=384 RepID=UPI001031149B|nr:LysR family transcriptional regulator [Rhizobium leguminosarum]TAX87284.1 LysR family transcriptional regulator [Rhizobium leguminosarum]
MDFDDLKTFCRVAQLSSIAAAARAEASDASTVSRRIAALEAQLGTRLFQRTTRKLSLTEAGTIFLSRILPILDDVSAAREAAVAAVEQPGGLLRVTASNAYGEAVVAPLLAAFCAQYPKIEIDLLLSDALVDLVAQQVDVALRLGPRPAGDLIVSKLKTIERRLVASKEYLSSVPRVEQPGDIVAHVCLPTTNSPQPPMWLFRRDVENIELVVPAKIRTSNTLALRQLVRDGVGISLLPEWSVDEDIESGRLVQLLSNWKISVEAQESAVWIAYPSRAYLPLKTRKFIDYLRERVLSPVLVA